MARTIFSLTCRGQGDAPGERALRACETCRAIYRTDFARCPIDGGVLGIVGTDPLIGAALAEKYVIDELLGEGAMGRVYRAHHARLGHRRYAVKVMLGDLAASSEMRMRFAHEAKHTSVLDHPNIIGIVDFGRTDAGLMYLVMELVEGPTLGALLRAAPFEPARMVAFARQLCEGLAHAHDRGVIHRDFKPDNVVVSARSTGETPRIGDFGLAITNSGDDARLTTSGVMCTPAYAAPEQLLGGAIDHRVDLYALGATLFEMLTGKLAFAGDPNYIATRKLAGATPQLAAFAPATPPGLCAIVERLLAREPDARYASARDVIAALDGYEARLRVRPPTARVIGRRRASLFGGVVFAGSLAWFATAFTGAATPASLLPAAPAPPRAIPTSSAVDAATPPAARPRIAAPAPPPPLHTRTVAVHEALRGSPVRARVAALAPPSPPSPPPPPSPTAVRTSRRAHIVQLSVDGALSPSVVRRAIERVLPQLDGCMDRAGLRVVSAKFTIEEARRASRLRIADGSGACVAAALAGARTEVAPDVGGVDVAVRIEAGS